MLICWRMQRSEVNLITCVYRRAYLCLTLYKPGVEVAIELVKCLCESLLCFLIGFHDYCLEIDWEAVPTHTHTTVERSSHRSHMQGIAPEDRLCEYSQSFQVDPG